MPIPQDRRPTPHTDPGPSSGRRPRKKSAPRFQDTSPALPSIDEFKLGYILSQNVRQESQNVVDSLLNVSQNYQADLKNEIRNKLSVEQKIQYKNIDIAKLSSKLSKTITHRNRKLEKVYSTDMQTSTSDLTINSASTRPDSHVDAELAQLLELSAKSSMLIKQLCTDLNVIDKKVNKSRPGSVKYPMISKFLAPKQPAVASEVRVSNGASNGVKIDSNGSKLDSNGSKLDSNGPIPKNTSQANGTPVTQSTEDLEAPDMSDPENFESFMASTISKYRNLQLENHTQPDIFLEPEIHETKVVSPIKGNNPLNLLYSSIITKSLSSELANSFTTSNFVSIKSIPTVELTPQVSHFKKLRINGSPITSATYTKIRDRELQNCGCNEDETSKLVRNECLSVDKRAFDDAVHYNGASDDTDEDSEFEDPILTSESSDLSSDSEDGDNTTNQYYLALKTDLRKKKNNIRRKRIRRTQARIRKEASPTPKHKPSHHILKPKRSILKMPKNETRRAYGVRVRSPSRSRSPKMEIKRKSVDKKPKTVSVKNSMSVIGANDYMVAGTIIAQEGSENGDLKSKLKDLL